MAGFASILLAAAAGSASALVFRPPAVPLITQSPLFSSWSRADYLYLTTPSLWTGDAQDWCAAARVDGTAFGLIGSCGDGLQPAQQLEYASVRATQTVAYFKAGPVFLNLTFTSPLLLNDWDLLSRPAHYITASVSSADGAAHSVQLYVDMTGWLVANDDVPFTWNRTVVPSITGGPSATALSLGAAQQAPLGGQDPTNDRPSWGVVYLLTDDNTTTSLSLQYAATSRQSFLSKGVLPPSDLNNNSPLPLMDPTTNTPLAATALINLAVSADVNAVTTSHLTLAIDEFLSISWFGMANFPPYWRRALPIGDTSVVPTEMLSQAISEYQAVISACNLFDEETANLLTRVGGEEYAAIGQLVYRQVLAQMALVWNDEKKDVWYFLKEASSCGCLQTADVLFPMFPILAYYSPELLKRTLIPNLEYSMNFTTQPYPLPWAPHHLGHWPLANLPYTQQENMPLEESAWALLSIAVVAQRQGGDLTWLTPYWPLIPQWYDFLVNLMPFPGTQLSTDDFDGVLYNASNLATKGIAAIASAGYLFETFLGNMTMAIDAYTTAALDAQTFVQYSWSNGTGNAPANLSHFLIGYKGSQGDGGQPGSWAMQYNLLWFRLLGYNSLLPNQQSLLAQQEAWYAKYQMNPYGIPLNSRKTFTKLDWMTFLAATYYNADGTPSQFSSDLFSSLFAFANETSSRVPLSDWTNTIGTDPTGPTAVGFMARPVFGAMWAPVLISEMGSAGSSFEAAAAATIKSSAKIDPNAVFEAVHQKQHQQ